MSDFILLILILVLVVCITVTIAAFVLYSGLLSDVVIKTGPPPIKNVTIAYKFKEGPYKDCGAAYTESCSIGPKLSTIAIFYDDPKQPADQCRYIVGSILSEGEEKPNEELQKLYEKFGFKVFSLPEVSHAVTSSFPCTSPLSHVVAPNRVYPQLAAYIQTYATKTLYRALFSHSRPGGGKLLLSPHLPWGRLTEAQLPIGAIGPSDHHHHSGTLHFHTRQCLPSKY